MANKIPDPRSQIPVGTQLAYIALGSNLGDRLEYLIKASDELDRLGELVAASSIYETEPLLPAAGGLKLSQKFFLNQVVAIRTSLTAETLLLELKRIEKKLGRKARARWAEREIDLDILLHGQSRIWRPELVIPHPYLTARRFVLVPLTEISPDLIHPSLSLPIKTLLKYCPDSLKVRKWKI